MNLRTELQSVVEDLVERAVKKAVRRLCKVRWGIVHATPGGGVVTVSVGGGNDIDLAYNANYTPVINDVVLILEQGADKTVICKLA